MNTLIFLLRFWTVLFGDVSCVTVRGADEPMRLNVDNDIEGPKTRDITQLVLLYSF